MLVYHIEKNVETHYITVFDALESMKNPQPVFPWVPVHAMLDEDTMTPRICVAPSIEQCFMGCTLYPFRRCCSKVQGMLQYRGLPGEAYPIIVNVFDADAPYVPSANEVPDAQDTGEMWLLEESTPIHRAMYWLTTDAIEAYGPESFPAKDWPKWADFHMVDSVKLLTTEEALTEKLDHPWLNRRGHCLNDKDNRPIVWGQTLHCLVDGWPQAA